MAQMAVQVAFLIDTDVGSGKDVPISNSICLTCLRLLHVLSANSDKQGIDQKVKRNHTSVKWGYKFFSSKNPRTKIEFHNFYEFKLKYFEEFENEVQKRLEENSDLQPTTATKWSKTVKPSQCINKALTEVLSDFHWEKPDITSPLKGQRHKTRQETPTQTNIVFLFSNLPKNNVQLKAFSGKLVPDDEVFLETFLPSSLLREFCHVSRITLNWIDTELIEFESEGKTDIASLQLIEKALSQAGGQVYGLESVVTTSRSFVDETYLLGEQISERKNSGNLNSGVLLPSTVFFGCSLPSTKIFNSLNAKESTICSFDIGSKSLDATLVPTSITEPHTGNVDESTDLDVAALMNDTQVNVVNHHNDSLDRLTLYGVLPRTSIDWVLQPVSSYLCTVSSTGGNLSGTRGDYSMKNLIDSMINKGCCLIWLTPRGQLAVLEPLTTSTAGLSVLCPASTLAVEKHLVCQENQMTGHSVQSSVHQPWESLVHRLTSKNRSSLEYITETDLEMKHGHMDGQVLERWHVPSSRLSLTSLISKLNTNMEKLDFLSSDETSLLRQLQKVYRQERQPPGLRDTSVSQNTDIKENETTSSSVTVGTQKGRRSRTSISRAEMILYKSKEVVKERGQREEEEEVGQDKQEKSRPSIAAQHADFQNEDELKQYLCAGYDKLVSGESSDVDVTTQTFVTVVQHYMKQTGEEKPQEKSASLLEGCLLLSESKLREKYLNNTDLDKLDQKIREYELQVMLRLEVLVARVEDASDNNPAEETVDQIVGLLRTLSFTSDPGLISKFLQANVLYNYLHTIPKLLANIYDELMQPLPACLAEIIESPNTSADQSVLNTSLDADLTTGPPSARTRSHGQSLGSVGPHSDRPGSASQGLNDSGFNISRRSRNLVHHPSLSDFGGKRQIVVEKVSRPKEKKPKRTKDSSKKKKDKVAKSLFGAEKRGTKLERRQSVAVMQSTHKTPKKSSTRLNFNSPKGGSPRARMVAETPNHKQQASQRFRLPSGPDTDGDAHTSIIEESPEKACASVDKDTPTKAKRAKALLRRSFYSAGPIKRNRNMTQYFQLADKIAGRTRHSPSEPVVKRLSTLITAEPTPSLKSPDRNSSFLLSQLAASPSPAKRTPRKAALYVAVAESPSQNTRSRGSPAVNLFKSPSARPSQKHETSPARRLLQSPVGRRQSPRVLIADSDTKRDPLNLKETPKKSPVVGSVSFGLDSPSQATRKLSMTPTRKSVRAALFAKSPAAIKSQCQSPSTRGSVNRQSLMMRFASPQKEADLTSGIDQSKNLQTSLGSAHKSGTDKRKRLFSPMKHNINTANCKTVTNNEDRKENINQSVQITPPQDKKQKITKTPDSFDKWHRRKVRSSQSSPSVNKLKVQNKFTEEVSDAPKISHPVECRGSLKRSLVLSPDSVQDVPSKRQRGESANLSKRDLNKPSCLSSNVFGSQGFDVTGSFSLSQKSDASSVEYFSASNDDVFLTDDTARTEEDMDIDGDNHNQHNTAQAHKQSQSSKSSLPGWSSPRFKSSVQSPLTAISNSPVSNAKHPTRGRHESGDRMSRAGSKSPRKVSSPINRKYSPNVSAKSLMHLIQSPLLKSPESARVESKQEQNQSPQRKLGDRSRRSLKLHN